AGAGRAGATARNGSMVNRLRAMIVVNVATIADMVMMPVVAMAEMATAHETAGIVIVVLEAAAVAATVAAPSTARAVPAMTEQTGLGFFCPSPKTSSQGNACDCHQTEELPTHPFSPPLDVAKHKIRPRNGAAVPVLPGTPRRRQSVSRTHVPNSNL